MVVEANMLHNTSRLELQVRAACFVVCEIGTRLAMACACFLPTCRACCRGSDVEAASQEPEAAPPCACFLPFCRRCFPQAPPGGDGDSGEEHEDTSQESASSDTEPEELAGPAGINAFGPQHSVGACFLPDCLVCFDVCDDIASQSIKAFSLSVETDLFADIASHLLKVNLFSCNSCLLQ